MNGAEFLWSIYYIILMIRDFMDRPVEKLG